MSSKNSTDLPLVSIPVFTYNGENFLAAQLDSLYAQTYKNIEIIVCDDGSTDRTLDILSQYQQTHNLNVNVNKTNIGLNKNVAKALSLCQGDYIAPCDQDDIWLPEKIEKLVDNIKDNILIYSFNTTIDENENVINDSYKNTEKLISGDNCLAFLFGNCASGHTILFKRHLLDWLSPVPKDILLYDQWIMFVASVKGTVNFVSESLVFYRRHVNQFTAQHKMKSRSVIHRFMVKDAQKKEYFKKLSYQFSCYAALLPTDHPDSVLVETIHEEINKLPSVFFSRKLNSLLKHNAARIFAMSDASEYKKLAKHLSKGLWYYRCKLFL